jgi:hypothetical protein
MRSRIFLFVALIAIAASALAAETKIYTSYETVRQALLKTSLAEVQSSAKQLASIARAEKQNGVAAKADAVATANDITAARTAFAALSDAVIKFGGKNRPLVVAWCAMERKSWLQPKGEIANPYVAPSMRKCGEVKAN